jgi:hypothetical protein
MDKIQKVLVKAGRKDLAQKYYEKFSSKKNEELMFEKESQGGFLELMMMDPNWNTFEKGLKALEKVWRRWENGPMTQPFHVNLAKKELTDYVMSEIRKIY